MKVELLNRLADLLEADANNPEGVKFDLHYWAHPSNGTAKYDGFVQGPSQITVDCGTSACAMGLAAISGAFRDEGLGWVLDKNSQLQITLGDLDGFEAAVELFGISPREANILFDPNNYPFDLRKGREAELEVVNRIRRLIADGRLSGFHDHFIDG